MEGIAQISIRGLEQGTVIGLHGLQADIYPLTEKTTTIDTDQYRQVYLIVYNLERAENLRACREKQYTVQVIKGTEAVEPEKTIPAPHFRMPEVEPFTDPQ